MDIQDWLLLPATILLGIATLMLLMTLVQVFAVRRHVRRRRHLAAAWRTLLLLVFAALTLVLGGGGMALRGYRNLSREAPVAELRTQARGPQRWMVELTLPDGDTHRVTLDGDAFRVEADVVKWKLPAVLGGAPAVYRLDRLSGRYDDPGEELEAPRTVVPLRQVHMLDLWRLQRRFPQWMPGVDAVYGSGAYLPMVDGGRYRVSLSASGGLIARPADAATAQRLREHPRG